MVVRVQAVQTADHLNRIAEAGERWGEVARRFAEAIENMGRILRGYPDACPPRKNPKEIPGKFYRAHVGYPQLPSVQLAHRREWRRCMKMYQQKKLPRLARGQR